MDVILAQLGPRELESHCRDAMKTQLTAMQRALNDAVAAVKRAEEVQLASNKLSITLFEDGSELSSALLVSTWLRDEMDQSLERVVALALGTLDGGVRAAPPKSAPSPRAIASTPPMSDATPQKKRKGDVQTTEETSAKKRKRLPSTASECAPQNPAKSPEAAKKPKSTSILTKALASCSNLSEELVKKKKMADRVPGLKTLVQHFNTAHKNLDRNSIIDQIEALDMLSMVAGMAVSIMQHGKPEMKRHWVQKFRDNIANIQEQFPDSAAAFNGYTNSLSKIISGFPLTVKEGQQLRMRLRRAVEEAKGAKDGHYTIADVTQNMSLLAEALESTCPNWTPRTDKTIRELAALLLDKVGLCKSNKNQVKRKRKLQSWLDLMDQAQGASQEPPTKRSPSASDAKAASKKSSKSQDKKQVAPGNTSSTLTSGTKTKTPQKGSPHLLQNQDTQPRPSNTVLPELSSSAASSDAVPTQPESCIKVEVSE